MVKKDEIVHRVDLILETPKPILKHWSKEYAHYPIIMNIVGQGGQPMENVNLLVYKHGTRENPLEYKYGNGETAVVNFKLIGIGGSPDTELVGRKERVIITFRGLGCKDRTNDVKTRLEKHRKTKTSPLRLFDVKPLRRL